MSAPPTRRTATRVVSGDALRNLERPTSTTRAFIEAAYLADLERRAGERT